MKGFDGVPDREILIEVAIRQQSLEEVVKNFVTEQKSCNAGYDDRLRRIEIDGSKPVEEIKRLICDVIGDVDDLKTFKNEHDGENKQTMKIAAAIAGVISTTSALIVIIVAFLTGGRY